MKQVDYTNTKVVCWLSEIRIEPGILYFVYNPTYTPSPESTPRVNHLNKGPCLKLCFWKTSKEMGVGGRCGEGEKGIDTIGAT